MTVFLASSQVMLTLQISKEQGPKRSPCGNDKGSGLKKKERGAETSCLLHAGGPFARWVEVAIRLES